MGWKYKGKTEDDFDFVNKKYADWEAGRFATMPTPTAALVGKFCRYVGATTTTAPIYTNGTVYKCEEDTTTTPTSYKWTAVGSSGDYLPITGGTMTGTIVADTTYAITGVDNADKVSLCGGSTEGATLYLDGKSSTSHGSFYLQASNGEAGGTKLLQGKADGTLTWNGNNVICANGGTMTGELVSTTNYAITGDSDTGFIGFRGGSTQGASLFLDGKSSSSNGAFFLQTHNGTDTVGLIGKADGTLTWDDNNVICSNGGTMNGTIVSTIKEALARDNNTTSTHIYGGTGNATGASLQLMGGQTTSTPGTFFLKANDGTNSSILEGTTNGTLDWGGKYAIYNGAFADQTRETIFAKASETEGKTAIISKVTFTAAESPSGSAVNQFFVECHSTSGGSLPLGYIIAKNRTGIWLCNVNNTYGDWQKISFGDCLPLTGGTMTGTISSTVSSVIVGKSDFTSRMYICSGPTGTNDGAKLQINGKSASGSPGQFFLVASNGTNSPNLNGKPDGSLTWNNKPIGTLSTLTDTAGNTWIVIDYGAYANIIGSHTYASTATTAWGNIFYIQYPTENLITLGANIDSIISGSFASNRSTGALSGPVNIHTDKKTITASVLLTRGTAQSATTCLVSYNIWVKWA